MAQLFDKSYFHDIIQEKDLTAVKLHFGERGLTTYLNPVFARVVVDKLKSIGAVPFLTDTNTLYVHGRHNAAVHVETALQHGFGYAATGAPVIIADGLKGHSSKDVSVNGDYFDFVKIAEAILDAESMVVLSHVKMHVVTGLGGAIKNLSMGCSSRAGKYMMHADVNPEIKGELCRACGLCLGHCPEGAISLQGNKASIDRDKCIGCGECIVACSHEAVEIDWTDDSRGLQEKMAEFALGAVAEKEGKCCYINFVLDVTPHCDCHTWSDSVIVPDVGILASFDPVAVDQASVDLINEQPGIGTSKLEKNLSPGEDKFRGVLPECDYTAQLRHAEKIGLGQRKYELVRV